MIRDALVALHGMTVHYLDPERPEGASDGASMCSTGSIRNDPLAEMHAHTWSKMCQSIGG